MARRLAVLVNFLLFQAGWFACVLGAAQERPWLGVVVVAIVVAVHLAMKATPREVVAIGAAAIVGVVVDTILLGSGFVVYASQAALPSLAPAWIVAMWVNFAITLRHSLGWLESRYVLGALLGALFGPLAYWGAARLGAVELSDFALPALATVWGGAVPGLFWLSKRVQKL